MRHVIGILTDQPDSRRAEKYWSVLKIRLKAEGNEWTTNCSQLKLKAADGKEHINYAGGIVVCEKRCLAFLAKTLIIILHGWHEAFCRMYIILVAGFGNGAGRQRDSLR